MMVVFARVVGLTITARREHARSIALSQRVTGIPGENRCRSCGPRARQR
jgi:hypothetical protein